MTYGKIILNRISMLSPLRQVPLLDPGVPQRGLLIHSLMTRHRQLAQEKCCTPQRLQLADQWRETGVHLEREDDGAVAFRDKVG